MTASDVQAGTWAPCGPPFSSYEATHGIPGVEPGQVRSVDRYLTDGRHRQAKLLAQRKPGKYWQVNVTDDDGRKCAGVPAHKLIMLAWEGPCPPGKQVRHYDDDPDHNWWAPGGEAAIRAGGPGNLVYGTPKEQWDDKLRNKIDVIPLESKAAGYRQSWHSWVKSLLRRWRR
jgi:hypothetical protein